MSPLFDLQGHRGARGQRPENTLPSVEAALDAGVSSIETDLHLTRDDVLVLCHDAVVGAPIFSECGPAATLNGLRIRDLTLEQLRGYRAAGNPDPQLFPRQDTGVTPLARLYARDHGIDPYAVPTLVDLFRFTAAYAGNLGQTSGKSPHQREKARQVRYDLELKRVPFYPETLDDGYSGRSAGRLEECLVTAVAAAGLAQRVTVRSFDHRCVRFVRRLAPELTGAVLVSNTAPAAPAELVHQADGQTYCPSYRFVDEEQIEQVHRAGYHVLPWTVNDPAAWERLLAWGVDGITTDYPQQLADWLQMRKSRGGH